MANGPNSDDIDIDLDDRGAPGAERRQLARERMKLGVRFTTAQQLAQAVRASTRNIGLGGLCLLTQKPYASGTELEVTIELGGNETLQVAAVVAWSRPGKAIGVRFLRLDASQRERIERLIGKPHDEEPAASGDDLERAVDGNAGGQSEK